MGAELFPPLRERIDQKAGTLSGGEQQMLAVGRALLGNPTQMLLDEPSMGLAPVLVDLIFQTMSGSASKASQSCSLNRTRWPPWISPATATSWKSGRLTLQGPAERLLTDDSVAAAYLGGQT
jgi:branched-chain amino acid transport system ATP-binding protein